MLAYCGCLFGASTYLVLLICVVSPHIFNMGLELELTIQRQTPALESASSHPVTAAICFSVLTLAIIRELVPDSFDKRTTISIIIKEKQNSVASDLASVTG